jgi:hypothetical protein
LVLIAFECRFRTSKGGDHDGIATGTAGNEEAGQIIQIGLRSDFDNEAIRAGSANERGGSISGVQNERVIANATNKRVGANATEQTVVAGTAKKAVIPRATHESVVAG